MPYLSIAFPFLCCAQDPGSTYPANLAINLFEERNGAEELSFCSNLSKIQVSRRKERVKRSIGDLAKAVYLVEFDENSKGDIRQKRDINDEVVKVDARCNNDVLRTIIVENIDRVTAVSKRRIQAECERRLEGRFTDNELSKENTQISPGDLRAVEGGVRREYGGGGSGEIGYVFGCLSYEIIWCMFVLIGVLKKSDVCMLLCIMCNWKDFLAYFLIIFE
ncbi:unnamed protein product [Nippostrongylus brasiliensis]|uniref:Uncharacterized protein n=1 Tax=Nippostrongylus brasiliensis TaxID=27835 RepID=A0A0N4YLE7_NIPBR|nr:unnamed protein product [Nippostrongylus brasiliensis]